MQHDAIHAAPQYVGCRGQWQPEYLMPPSRDHLDYVRDERTGACGEILYDRAKLALHEARQLSGHLKRSYGLTPISECPPGSFAACIPDPEDPRRDEASIVLLHVYPASDRPNTVRLCLELARINRINMLHYCCGPSDFKLGLIRTE